ncbi:tetratricopeptide repeat protein [Polaribacter sp.]|nr:tetratricopeptide repeat protein [Polaribacter sp.]
MPLLKFESMLKTNSVYFFDLAEFEEIILHYLDTGKPALAKRAVTLGLEQHPTSVDLKLMQVEIFIFEDELEKASNLLKKIEKIVPNNDEVFIQKGNISSKSGKHEEAISFYNTALEMTDDKSDIWSFIGMEYLYLDDFENARLNFTKCMEVDFEDYSSLYNIIYCFDMDSQHEEAVIYLNDYLDTNPYCEVAWHQLGRQFFTLNRFTEALTAFDFAVVIDEFFIGGYIEKAKTLEELKRYEEAIENYKITLELDDPTAYVFVRIGECYEMLEQFDNAISYYKKAVHEDPLLDKGWMLLTNLYYKQENYQKASYYINKALKIEEHNALYWERYAEICLKLHLFEETAVGFRNCLDLKTDALEIYIALTDVLTFLGEFEEAITVLFKAQKIYKNFAEIEYRLTGLFFVLNKEQYAIQHLINALNIDFEYYTILEELFPSVVENEKIKKLISNYEKATQ